MTSYRRAGSRWRLLVHDMAPDGEYGISRHYQSHPDKPPLSTGDAEKDRRLAEVREQWSRTEVVPDTELDELVIGKALHVEQMDHGTYWMSIAGITVWLRMDRDGRATSVDVHGPGDYDEPWDGVTYGGAFAPKETT